MDVGLPGTSSHSSSSILVALHSSSWRGAGESRDQTDKSKFSHGSKFGSKPNPNKVISPSGGITTTGTSTVTSIGTGTVAEALKTCTSAKGLTSFNLTMTLLPTIPLVEIIREGFDASAKVRSNAVLPEAVSTVTLKFVKRLTEHLV